ncbi:endo-1,4-beta-xylanase [Piscinibacter sp. HJYY11]|uniref:endo-1,4-beta-xylanase n=1 Tax=Piscinibacter sp. HJYY11 TaxID=2801333 RepID=UPI00191DCA24|nr:endo-1,4-beta-xylanase [Piscinibacter sp. HJYY11]MBL0728764.1 endo-1,4-beta-xylanase [Piscinibacter sp. HJYY11]
MSTSQFFPALKRAIACTGVALGLLCAAGSAHAQLATGKPKFLGNIIAGSVPQSFNTYWNQVTPENSGKWGSVEAQRNQMNWGPLDTAYNYARANGFPFKQHTFVWGAQEPGWIGSLGASQQAYEVEEFMRLYCQRYPQTQYIDVVNEPISQPASYRNALGGAGSTGWDWIVWSFQKARQHCPTAKLLLNEYGIINDATKLNRYKGIVNILKARGLIDGVGIQAHYFSMDNLSAATMKANLDSLAQAGVPIFVSELDMTGDDSTQLARYQRLFPGLWTHPGVAHVTLWGYIEGQTWVANSHLVRRDGSERPAMAWLKNYVRTTQIGGGGDGGTSKAIVVRARGTTGQESVTLRIGGTAVRTWTLSTTMTSYTINTTLSGGSTLEFTNDATGRDVQVDYLSVNGSVRQAEAQTYNTGVYQNGACGGGSGRSEWLHCNGAIGFGAL